MRAAVIVNAHSGRSGSHLGNLPGLLAEHGVEAVTFAIVENERDLRKQVKRARKSGIGHIIVGGGDGSMATAVDLLAKRDVVLGVLPLGTGNSFARSVGLDDSLDKALAALAAPRVERVDLGLVNGTYFANFATIGLSAEIAASASRGLKRAIGAASYVASGIVPFVHRRPFRAKVTWDDGTRRKEKKSLETVQIVVASGRFFGHRPIAPDATIVDHRLAFFTTTGVSHLEVARMYFAMGLGLQNELPDAIAFSAQEIVVKAKPKQRVSIDGNAFGETPARFRVAPCALRVIVGPDFDDVNR
jgi:YegS/Rv2252/BmrU family lipid kinase